MISPQDLRIGNMVNHKGHGVSEVRKIDAQGFLTVTPLNFHGTIGSTPGDVDGIPLNDEWLMKLGFWEKYKSTCNRWYLRAKHLNAGCEILDPEDDETGKLTGKFYYNNSDGQIDVKYVHQLQNLYYALTQEELTIK